MSSCEDTAESDQTPPDMKFIQSLLRDNAMDKFYVIYTEGGAANHMLHAVIALYHLGAGRRQITEFVKKYTEGLAPRGGEVHQTQSDSGESVEELLGTKRGFYTVLDHYTGLMEEKYDNSMEKFLQGEFPRRLLGLGGAVFHGLMQTGYGVASGCPHAVCEGMSYMHYWYFPLVISQPQPDVDTLGKGSMSILEVISKVREEKLLRGGLLDIQDFLEKKGYILLNYVQQIHIPDDVISVPEDAKLTTLLKYLTDSTIILYQSSKQINDFFLLHGVSSSFALTQVLSLLGDWKLCLEAIRTWLCVLIAVYIAQQTPELDMERLEEPDVSNVSWEDIKCKILAMKSDDAADIHVTKLVQICYDMSLVNKDAKMADIYKRACFTVMDNPFIFRVPVSE